MLHGSSPTACKAYLDPDLGRQVPVPHSVSEGPLRLTLPATVELMRDEVYSTRARALRLDILGPKDAASLLPVLLFIHGGGFAMGNKEAALEGLVPFALRGYLCASVEYRLSGEAIFPAQIEDCKTAVRFLRAHAKEWHLDPERIGVWGRSAGGHLAALLGTSGGVEALEGQGEYKDYSSHISAVCDWFGPVDLLRMNEGNTRLDHDAPGSPASRLIGGPVQEHRKEAAKANPIGYISERTPPFLIMHGDKDDIVPINQSELLYKALVQAGVPVNYYIVRGAGHGGPEFSAANVVEIVSSFFDKHLKSSFTGVRKEQSASE